MTAMADTLPFTKGHGTENDFVLVPDLEGALDLMPSQVALLADRRAGIGGDGVIRVVPTSAAAEESVRAQADEARWFMDYRNADGRRRGDVRQRVSRLRGLPATRGARDRRRVRDRHALRGQARPVRGRRPDRGQPRPLEVPGRGRRG